MNPPTHRDVETKRQIQTTQVVRTAAGHLANHLAARRLPPDLASGQETPDTPNWQAQARKLLTNCLADANSQTLLPLANTLSTYAIAWANIAYNLDCESKRRVQKETYWQPPGQEILFLKSHLDFIFAVLRENKIQNSGLLSPTARQFVKEMRVCIPQRIRDEFVQEFLSPASKKPTPI